MAYNQFHKLKRIIEIQNITLAMKKKGISQVQIYREYIRPRFLISLRTYNTYLATNARKCLRQLYEEKAIADSAS